MIATVPAIRRSSSAPYASNSEPNESDVTKPLSAPNLRHKRVGNYWVSGAMTVAMNGMPAVFVVNVA
jgi:hypothetical protein